MPSLDRKPDKDRPRGGQSLTATRGGAAYQGAIEAVVALLLAMGAGFWIDGRYGTAPRFLLIGTVIGFGAFVLRLWRLRRVVEQVAAEEKESRSSDDD